MASVNAAVKEVIAFRRPQNVLNFQKNSNDTNNLHLGRQYRELECRLSGVLTIGTADATAVVEDAPYSLIKKVEIMANGNVPIKTLTGKALKELTGLRDRVMPASTAPGTGTGNHTIDAYFRIPFWMPMAGLAMDSSLVNATSKGGITSLTISIDWGDAEDLVTPDATTVLSWDTEPTIDVLGHDMVGMDNKKYVIHRERTITKEVGQTSERFLVDIHSGPNRKLIGALVIAREAGARTDDIINKLSVETDSDVRYQVSSEMCRARTDAMFERATARDGVYYLDIAPRQLIGHGIEEGAVSSLDLVLDVTAGDDSSVEIVPIELIGSAG